jgi:hypothetical protein
MKLNPEDLDVVSFDTAADPDVQSQAATPTIDTGFPTPDTYCFVCD